MPRSVELIKSAIGGAAPCQTWRRRCAGAAAAAGTAQALSRRLSRPSIDTAPPLSIQRQLPASILPTFAKRGFSRLSTFFGGTAGWQVDALRPMITFSHSRAMRGRCPTWRRSPLRTPGMPARLKIILARHGRCYRCSGQVRATIRHPHFFSPMPIPTTYNWARRVPCSGSFPAHCSLLGGNNSLFRILGNFSPIH
jgi:hypothetical protein